WGFLLLRKSYAPKRVTNIRDDKVGSAFWRKAMETRRCLVPASSYCEPNGATPAVWHWFAMKGEDQRPVFAFPGVWTSYRVPIRKDGPTVEQNVFAFMTTLPNELTAVVNHERMPVLLTKEEEFETWLSGTTDEAMKLARSFASEAMHVVQAGADKQD